MRSRMWLAAVAGAMVVMTGCEEDPTALDAQTSTLSLAQAADDGSERSGLRRGPPAVDPVRMILAQKEELALSASQVAQLEQIAADLRVKNQPLLETIGAPGGRAAMDRPALQGLSAEERRAKLQEMREARRAEGAQLTQAQRAERKAQMEARRAEGAQLTQEQRQAQRAERKAQMEARRPQLEQLRNNQNAAAEAALAVLSAEQRAVVEAKREARQAERVGKGRPNGFGWGQAGGAG
jgi:hypothetical protein